MKWRILLLAVLAAASAEAYAADTMRCGNRIVKRGDPQAKVLELCGRPTSADTRTIYRSGLGRRDFSVQNSDTASYSDREILVPGRTVVPVEVDVWLYNQGRNRLMREVVFSDNRVITINTLERGY